MTHADFTILTLDKKGETIDETIRQWEVDSGVIRANAADILHREKDVAELQVKKGDELIHAFVRDENGKCVEKVEE